ncbi:MAG: TIGR00282 family metallophosphoesterase [Alphaproteobacteria bacterium]
MKVLFLGDVVGRAGRQVVCDQLPELRHKLGLDFVVVNGENAAGGFGITEKICRQFYDVGVDVITSGNHIWAQRAIIGYIDGDHRLLRPINYPEGTPGRGVGVYDAPRGRKVMVMNLMGRVFMEAIDNPFARAKSELAKIKLGVTVDFVLVDVHCEATSEKMALGHFCDGQVSMVVGSHSHVPTADAQVLTGGTAYQTDAGMCGDYDSVIGMEKEEPLRRFTRQLPDGRFEPALGEATLCGVYVESDDQTGLAVHVAPLRMGGRLTPHWPT